jgi:hypothetical protein
MDDYFDGMVYFHRRMLFIRRMGFSGFFNRQSEFLAQWQRIVAQRYKIVYQNVESWYF